MMTVEFGCCSSWIYHNFKRVKECNNVCGTSSWCCHCISKWCAYLSHG